MQAQHPFNLDTNSDEGQDEILYLWTAAKLAVGQDAWIMKMTQEQFSRLRRTGVSARRLRSLWHRDTLISMPRCSRWPLRASGRRRVNVSRQPSKTCVAAKNT